MILTEITSSIQNDLKRVDQAIAQSLKTENLFIQQMVDYLARSTGKRVRPALAILSAKYCGHLPAETITLGAALEMIHVATLIHDDIIDNSAIRRKQKTLNFKWGNEISVLMGDYVFASSFYLMAKTLPKDVLGTLADTTNIICRGEISETFNRFNVGLTEDQYLEVIKEKTASLFAASCQTGAMLAGGDELTVDRLYRFGMGIGMAFQVIDDTLDFTGKQSKIGKPVLSDLKEGKLTLPVIHALNHSSAAQKKKVKTIVLKKLKNTSDLKWLMDLLKKLQSVEYSITKARGFVADAKSALFSLNGQRDKNDLLQFADFLIGRDF
ncbi:MAG TPA: polyprenyl synthetase family protein [bacterium]|nr:polyprenyl synthetase family protein [bacterium]